MDNRYVIYGNIVGVYTNKTIDFSLINGLGSIIIECNDYVFEPLKTLFSADIGEHYYFKLIINNERIHDYAIIEKNIYNNLHERGFLK